MWQRFGLIDKHKNTHNTIWIHAVSVGEVIATQTIVKQIQSEFPNTQIVMTTGTPTGADTVKRLYQETVIHYFQPYDIGVFLKAFIKRLNPTALIVMETELWPNLFYTCHQRSIPILLVNARLSARSANRYQSFLKLAKPMMQCVNAIMAQSEEDAKNLISIGADPNIITVTGSVKFDIEIDEQRMSSADKFKKHYLTNRSVWIAASTHADEEQMMIDIHQVILERHPESLLILVPRHDVRAGEVINLLKNTSLIFQVRSQSQSVNPDTQILLVDTIGELLFFYGLADIAFIGGSLVEHGGHNPIEAAAYALPILFGLHDFNFREIDAHLIAQGGAIQVQDKSELQIQLLSLLESPEKSQCIGDNAFNYFRESQGNTKKVWNVLKSYLD